MTDGGSVGTAGAGFRAAPQPVPACPPSPSASNERRLAWFTNDDLLAELHRRLTTPSQNGAPR